MRRFRRNQCRRGKGLHAPALLCICAGILLLALLLCSYRFFLLVAAIALIVGGIYAVCKL